MKAKILVIGRNTEIQQVILRLSDQFRLKKKDIKIIRHYGGGSGLLFNELQAALGNQS
jgi:hypothetical protein